MSEWTTQCSAKLNLFLSVGPRDERGWHPLRTLFQAIDLWDLLTVELASKDEVVTNVDYLPAENTLTKALAAYRERCDTPYLAMFLEKRIPAQSGLGGGSSDAAGLLRILQKVVDDPLGEDELQELALSVGADVPFFLVGGRARAEGYGEKIEALADPSERHYLVVKPEVDCPTARMFQALDEMSYEWRPFPPDANPLPGVGEEIYNDFERVMPKICADQIEWLREFGALSAGLTGSGSAVFGEFETRTEAVTARELLKGIPEENVWVCRSLRREESLKVVANSL